MLLVITGFKDSWAKSCEWKFINRLIGEYTGVRIRNAGIVFFTWCLMAFFFSAFLMLFFEYLAKMVNFAGFWCLWGAVLSINPFRL
jgi:hypothetical protein